MVTPHCHRKRGLSALAKAQHRLNLHRVGCHGLWMFVGPVNLDARTQKIDEILPAGSVYSTYKKDKTEHQVVLHCRREEDPQVSYSIHWSVHPFKVPFTRVSTPIWDALDLAQDIAEKVDTQCFFSLDHEHFEPKLAIPLRPFAEGLLPFDEIGGYRAVRTEQGTKLWDAVIDREEDGDYTFNITIDNHRGNGGLTTEGVFERLIEIRDTLLVKKPND